MSTSRRSFIKSGTIVALAAAIPGTLGRSIHAKALLNLGSLPPGPKKSDFYASLNSTFRISSGSSDRVGIRLAKVVDLKRPPKYAVANKEGFSLLFEGPAGIPQDNYRFEHDKMGKFDFLMVPVESKKKRGHFYEVIVNRLYS